MPDKTGLLTIEQLAGAVAAALEAGGVATASGRVRDVPDVRTLRYYTTLGLLDRPAQMLGRTALYSRRHLLQLVAIKRLQAQGLPLAQVQARLVNATDRQLSQLAGLPANFEERLSSYLGSPRPDENKAISQREPGRVFWKVPPANEPATQGANSAASESLPLPRSLTFVGVPLSGDVSLLVGAVRPLDEADLAALHAAAEPLIATLRQRGLLT
jgi:DNA-binding transcriptional MerR regulator